MATITLKEPPAPFNCVICEKPQWQQKADISCNSCPSFVGTHYHPFTVGPEAANLIVVGDVPAPPPIKTFQLTKRFEIPATAHTTFDDSAGKIVRAAVNHVLSRREYGWIQASYTYAVRCAVDNPNKKTVTQCATHLRQYILQTVRKRQLLNMQTPVVVLACGVDVLMALNIPVRSEAEAQNRVFHDVDVAGTKVQVVFTRSLKAIGAQDGKYTTLLADVERAAQCASGVRNTLKERAQIAAQYRYPKTIAEVRELIDYVIQYTQGDVDPKDWKVAVDTETNTLQPNWDGTKIIMFSLAWAVGCAASILLWHPKNDWYDPADAFAEVKRFFESRKPVIWFNGKYDYKIFWKLGWPQTEIGNVYWDAFLAEHALEEDKKGLYSLKELTKRFLPELAGYEDTLQNMLEKEDDVGDAGEDDEVDVPAIEPTSTNDVVSPSVRKALDSLIEAKLIKSAKFQDKSIAKLLADEKYAAHHPALTLVRNAKKSGLFRAQKPAKKLKKETGGFEKIPIDELSFYAAVDVDATRQLAVQQVQRMHKEQISITKQRADLRALQAYSRDPKVTAYPVETLCDHPRPLFRLVQEAYLPRQRELAKMEFNGMRVDLKHLDQGSDALTHVLEHTRQKIYTLCETEFKLGSTQKLAQMFFSEGYRHPDPAYAEQLAHDNPTTVFYENGKIRYKPQAYTIKGAIQTGDQVLKGLVARYKCPLANELLTYKKADKGKNTFLKNIKELALFFGDNLLHSGYGLTTTATGRTSSSVKTGNARFNAQNIPKGNLGAIKDINGKLILNAQGAPVFEGVNCKKVFVPDDDRYCFGNADAKGAEVSIYAAYSRDDALIEALIAGLDAHCFFASEALNPDVVAAGLTGEAKRVALAQAQIDDSHAWSYQDFLLGKDDKHPDKSYGKRLKALRDNIKRMVFGMLYGAGVRKISEIAGISEQLGRLIQTLLFTKFPTIPSFMDQTKWELRQFNLVETFLGRRRRLQIGRDAPSDVRAQAERRAINFKIQATSSDIVLWVLCQIAPVIEQDFKGRLLLTVHDSIGFQVPKQYAGQMKELFYEYGTRRVAREYPWLPVPFRWDVELGPSYGELRPADEYVKQLPVQYLPELDGYTSEERDEDLQNIDRFETAPRKKAKKVA